MNEEFYLWVEALVDEGYDLSSYTWGDIYDIYEGVLEEVKSQQDEAYEFVLDYLIEEGYVNNYKDADCLIENMSQKWLMDILESKKWIQQAIQKPGALRKSLKAKSGKNIPVKSLKSASHKGGKMGRRARLALTLRKFH